MPLTNIDGVQTHYEVSGSEGLPVLFIHGGFGGAQSTIVRNPDEPAPRSGIHAAVPSEGIRLITYDRRCAGLSEYVLDWYSLTDIATDARKLLRHLEIERSVVVGSSMGGMVALQYALSYPDTVLALALVNTGANLMGDTGFGETLKQLVERAKSKGDDALFRENLERLRNPPELSHGAEIPRAVREEAEHARARYLNALDVADDATLARMFAGTIRNNAAFIGYDFSSRLDEITAPTIVIHGDADDIVPLPLGQALRHGIGHCEYHEIANARHGILRYAEAQAHLRDWLTTIAESNL